MDMDLKQMDYTDAVITFLPDKERGIILRLHKELKLLKIYKSVHNPEFDYEWIDECIAKTKEKAEKLVRETLSQYK